MKNILTTFLLLLSLYASAQDWLPDGNGNLKYNNTGGVGIGTDGSDWVKLYVSDNITAASQIPAQGRWGLFSFVNTNHTGTADRRLWGAYLLSLNGGTGTITETMGVNALSGVISSGNGTVTNAYGVYAGVQNGNGGVVTNGYGVYINNIGATNQYGLYQAGSDDKNYFAGNVGIGTTNPSQTLEIFNSNLFNPNMGAESQDHISFTSNTPGVNNFFGGITWKTGARRRASIVAVQEHTDSDHIGLAFFTQGTDGPGPIYESMRISRNGNVGIGTTDTKGYKLAVNGKAIATEIKVKTYVNWPDYVFKSNYKLTSLEKVEEFINTNGHLPNIPSADEVEENGILLGEMNSKLLQKIEELTLYTIEQEKKLQKVEELKNKVAKLEALVEQLINDKK